MLKKISEILLIIANIILAAFAIFAFFQVGNQFEKSSRPFIGFETGNNSASSIIQDLVYDQKPEIGDVWLPEDVVAGVTLNLKLENYGQLPAYFIIKPASSIGNIEPYKNNADFIMPRQVIESKWNWKWTSQVPDLSKELLSFDILYSSDIDNKEEYKTIIGTNFIKLPTKDEDEVSGYPYRLTNAQSGETYVLDFFIKEIK